MSKTWERKGEFINMVLAAGIFEGTLDPNDVVFNGVAGEQFEQVAALVKPARLVEYIVVAIKLGAPILERNVVLDSSAKWAEVVALCKEEQPEDPHRWAH